MVPLILVPEPTRAYSFLWNHETDYERTIRQASERLREYFDARLGAPIVLPPRVEVRMIGPGDKLFREKRLTTMVTIRPLNWKHTAELLSRGFEFA